MDTCPPPARPLHKFTTCAGSCSRYVQILCYALRFTHGVHDTSTYSHDLIFSNDDGVLSGVGIPLIASLLTSNSQDDIGFQGTQIKVENLCRRNRSLTSRTQSGCTNSVPSSIIAPRAKGLSYLSFKGDGIMNSTQSFSKKGPELILVPFMPATRKAFLNDSIFASLLFPKPCFREKLPRRSIGLDEITSECVKHSLVIR